MHLLVVTLSFPSPQNPYLQPFIGEQVRLLCERKEEIKRITVLSPTTFVPVFMRGLSRIASQASLPERYQTVEGHCEVLYPRYLKPPAELFLRWTIAQWRRIVDRTVAGFAKTCPISVIHAHYGSVSAWASICAAKRYGIPSVVTYQGSDVHLTLAYRKKGWQLCRDSFRLADLNLPVSRSLEDILRRHAAPMGRCEVLLRGVDRTRFFPAPELGVDPHVLFVGRIEKAKGAFDLLAAWEKVQLVFPAASLTMVGQDRTRGRFLQKVRALGLERSIKLTGPLPSPTVANMMRQSRLFCLPSHREGTPNCVMEALSSGLPVVATRVGGIPDIVGHEKSGLLVDREDVNGLAAALIALLSDPIQCARIGQAATAFAREHLDARQTVSRLVELYRELVEANSRSARLSGVSL